MRARARKEWFHLLSKYTARFKEDAILGIPLVSHPSFSDLISYAWYCIQVCAFR